MKPTVHDIRIGALYRFAAKRGLTSPEVAKLIHQRARLSEQLARELAWHWATTQPFKRTTHRTAAQESIRG